MAVPSLVEEVQERADALNDKVIERMMFLLHHPNSVCKFCEYRDDYVYCKRMAERIKKELSYGRTLPTAGVRTRVGAERDALTIPYDDGDKKYDPDSWAEIIETAFEEIDDTKRPLVGGTWEEVDKHRAIAYPIFPDGQRPYFDRNGKPINYRLVGNEYEQETQRMYRFLQQAREFRNCMSREGRCTCAFIKSQKGFVPNGKRTRVYGGKWPLGIIYNDSACDSPVQLPSIGAFQSER